MCQENLLPDHEGMAGRHLGRGRRLLARNWGSILLSFILCQGRRWTNFTAGRLHNDRCFARCAGLPSFYIGRKNQTAGSGIFGAHPFYRHSLCTAALHIKDMADVKFKEQNHRHRCEQERPCHAGIEQPVIYRNHLFSCHGSPSHSLVGSTHGKARLFNVALHLGNLLADSVIFRCESGQCGFNLL